MLLVTIIGTFTLHGETGRCTGFSPAGFLSNSNRACHSSLLSIVFEIEESYTSQQGDEVFKKKVLELN